MILRARMLPIRGRIRIKICGNDFHRVRHAIEIVPLGVLVARMRRQIDHGSGIGVSHVAQCRTHPAGRAAPTGVSHMRSTRVTVRGAGGGDRGPGKHRPHSAHLPQDATKVPRLGDETGDFPVALCVRAEVLLFDRVAVRELVPLREAAAQLLIVGVDPARRVRALVRCQVRIAEVPPAAWLLGIAVTVRVLPAQVPESAVDALGAAGVIAVRFDPVTGFAAVGENVVGVTHVSLSTPQV